MTGVVMKLQSYFETTDGFGVLSTADGKGNVDAAVYAKPHVIDDGRIPFIMRERLTHHNIQQNDSACYLFREEGGGYRGVRLYLTRVGEDQDPELIEKMTRAWLSPEVDSAKGQKFIVYFRLEKILSLIGDGTPDIS